MPDLDTIQAKKLYTAVSNKFNVGTFDEFAAKMGTADERKRFYDVVSKKGIDLGDATTYENRLNGTVAKTETPTQNATDINAVNTPEQKEIIPKTVTELAKQYNISDTQLDALSQKTPQEIATITGMDVNTATTLKSQYENDYKITTGFTAKPYTITAKSEDIKSVGDIIREGTGITDFNKVAAIEGAIRTLTPEEISSRYGVDVNIIKTLKNRLEVGATEAMAVAEPDEPDVSTSILNAVYQKQTEGDFKGSADLATTLENDVELALNQKAWLSEAQGYNAISLGDMPTAQTKYKEAYDISPTGENAYAVAYTAAQNGQVITALDFAKKADNELSVVDTRINAAGLKYNIYKGLKDDKSANNALLNYNSLQAAKKLLETAPQFDDVSALKNNPYKIFVTMFRAIPGLSLLTSAFDVTVNTPAEFAAGYNKVKKGFTDIYGDQSITKETPVGADMFYQALTPTTNILSGATSLAFSAMMRTSVAGMAWIYVPQMLKATANNIESVITKDPTISGGEKDGTVSKWIDKVMSPVSTIRKEVFGYEDDESVGADLAGALDLAIIMIGAHHTGKAINSVKKGLSSEEVVNEISADSKQITDAIDKTRTGQPLTIDDINAVVNKLNEIKDNPVDLQAIKELDTKILSAQEKLGRSTTPELFIDKDTQATLDKIDNNEQVLNTDLQTASTNLYNEYKRLEAIKASDTRQVTTDQINAAQWSLGEAVTKLENKIALQKETGEFDISQIPKEKITQPISLDLTKDQKPLTPENVIEDVKTGDVKDIPETIENVSKNLSNEVVEANKPVVGVTGKEIVPAPEVKTDVSTVIDEVVSDKGKTYGDIDSADGNILYGMKEKPLDAISYDKTDSPEIIKSGEQQEFLEKQGYIEQTYDDGSYELTTKGKEFVDAVDARLETRKGVKEGTDLFPEDANIPELKTIKEELKTQTDGNTINKYEQRTADEVSQSEPVIKALEVKEETATEKGSIEQLESEVDAEINKIVSKKELPKPTGEFEVVETIDYTKPEINNYKPSEQLKFNQGDKFEPVRIVGDSELIELIGIGAKENKQINTGQKQNIDSVRKKELESKYGITAKEANAKAKELAKANRDANIEKIIVIGEKPKAEPIKTEAPPITEVKPEAATTQKPKTTQEKITDADTIISDELSKLFSNIAEKVGGKKNLTPEEKVNITKLAAAIVDKTGLEIKQVIERIRAFVENKYPNQKEEVNAVLDDIVKAKEVAGEETKVVDFETSLKRSVADNEKMGREGIDAVDNMVKELPSTDVKQSFENAKDKVNKGVVNPDTVTKRVLKEKTGTEEDQAVLLYERGRLRTQEIELINRRDAAIDKATKDKISDELRDIYEKQADNDLAAATIGREASNIFRLRQEYIDSEFTLSSMEREFKSVRGLKELTPEQRARIKEVYTKLRQAEAKYKGLQDQLTIEKEARLAAEKALDDYKKNAKEQRKTDRKSRVKDIITQSKARVEKSKARLRELSAQLSSGVNPEIALEISKIATEKVYQGVVKLDALVKDILDEVKDIFPNWTEKDVLDNLSYKNKKGELSQETKIAQTLKKSAEVSKKIQEGDFSKPEKKQLTTTKELDDARAEYENLKWKWKTEQFKEELKNRPGWEKVVDKIIKARTAIGLLSGIKTLLKLFHYTVMETFVGEPLDIITTGISKLLFPKVAEKSLTEGNFNLKSYSEFYKTFFKKETYKEAKEYAKHRQAKIDLLWGDLTKQLPDEFRISGGLIHGVEKYPLRKATFVKEAIKIEQRYKEMGFNVDDPVVRKLMNAEAYNKANYRIMMSKNRISDLLASTQSKLRGMGTMGKLGFYVSKILFPIMRVPTNFSVRTMRSLGGILEFGLRMAKEMQVFGGEGIKKMTPEAADKALLAFKNGLPGLALGIIVLSTDSIDVDENGFLNIGGWKVPRYLTHHPMILTAKLYAEAKHEYNKKGGSTYKAIAKPLIETVKEIPYFNEQTLSAISDETKFKNMVQNIAVSFIEPQLLKDIASLPDHEKVTLWNIFMEEPIYRRPKTFLDKIYMGIPGLRQKVARGDKKKFTPSKKNYGLGDKIESETVGGDKMPTEKVE